MIIAHWCQWMVQYLRERIPAMIGQIYIEFYGDVFCDTTEESAAAVLLQNERTASGVKNPETVGGSEP